MRRVGGNSVTDSIQAHAAAGSRFSRFSRVAIGLGAGLLVVVAGAQEQWDFNFLATPHGVPLTEVRSITEDSRGCIWVATWGNGVARIDRTDWLTLGEERGLAGNWVRDVAAGADDTIWIATADGLSLYRGGQLTTYTVETHPVLPGNDLDRVVTTTGGDVLLANRNGRVVRIRGASNRAEEVMGEPARWATIVPGGDTSKARPADLYEDAEGRLWFSGRDGDLAVHDGETLSPVKGPGFGLLFAGRATGGGAAELRAARLGGPSVFQWRDGAWEPTGSAGEGMTAFVPGNDGWYYAGTAAGLYRQRGGDLEPVYLGDMIGTPHITTLYEASDGALWIGTREGLIRGSLREFRRFPSTRQGHPLVALVADPRPGGDLVAIDGDRGLARFSAGGWERFARLDAPGPLGYFHTRAGEPYLWCLDDTEAYQYRLEDGALLDRFPVPPVGTDKKLHRTAAGETWILARDGVYAWTGQEWVPRPEVPDYRRRRVYNLAEPEPGVFYVGLEDGVERWAGGEVAHYGKAEGVAEEDAARAICVARDGTLWIGTYGDGVYAYDGKTFTNYNERDGLAHHSVSNIHESRDGAIWVTYRRTGAGSYKDGRWLNFGNEAGLVNASIIGLFEDGGGNLWLNSREQGLFRYRPDTDPPDTFLEGATHNVPFNGIGVFSFRAVDAWQTTPAHALLYSWRLRAADSGSVIHSWSPYTPQTTYIVRTLDPGAYTMEVRAADTARNVDPAPAAVAFTVARPIWTQPGVYIPATILALLCLVALVLRVRAHYALRHSEAALSQSNRQLMSEVRERIQAEQRLNEHFEHLEELVEGRTAALEAAQRALVDQERLAVLGKVTASVSHELRNPLGTLRSTLFSIARRIQGLDLGLEPALERGERSIQRCDRIIDEFLDFTRTVSMDRERVDLDAWLRNVLDDISIPESVQCRFSLESGLELDVDPERLRRAVINVVNNAVQALVDHSGEFKRLRVKSRQRGEHFEIVVKDNGPGIPPEEIGRIFEPLYSTKSFGVGLGVPIVKEIMEKHGGGVEYHSVVGQGTTVVLWVPIAPTPPENPAE